MSAQRFYKFPFANAGDVAAVPNPAQGDGSMSYTEGWGLDYERDPATDPAAKRISRDQMNQILKDITDNIREYQNAGFPEFVTTAQNDGVPFAYPKNAYVRYDIVGDGTGWTVFCSLVNNNTALPTDVTKWAVSAPLTVAAVLASQAQVNQGDDDTKVVGPIELVRAAREGRWTFGGAATWATAQALTVAMPGAGVYTQTGGALVTFTVPTDSPAGPITLKLGPNAVKGLKSSSGDELEAGDLTATGIYTARYTGTEWRLGEPVASELRKFGSMGSGAIFGLITSNAAGATATHINIAAGNCRDGTNLVNMQLVAPLTKRIDQAWAAGSGNGMRDTGAIAAGQTWHIFMIFNPTTRAVDVLASQSAGAPVLPAGFTYFRRIWSIMLDATVAIRQYVQFGDWCRLVQRSADYAAQANGSLVPYLRKVTVPLGIKVEAEFYFQSTGTADGNAYLSGIYDPDNGIPPAFAPPYQWAQIRRGGIYGYPGAWLSYDTTIVRQFTDTAQNIYMRSSDNLDVIALGVTAWRDDRGRFF